MRYIGWKSIENFEASVKYLFDKVSNLKLPDEK
jgi:hypothetical protein